jgi:hypothetical protein
VILPRLKRSNCKRPKLWEITTRLLVCLMTLPLVAVHSRAGALSLAFLSGDNQDPHPGTRSSLEAFDGRWTFTSAGCTNTGSIGATIRHGRIIVRDGSGKVDPDGTLHSVGAGGGMTLTAVGHLDGETGSGTFDRSDGCSGTWIGIKRH